MGPTNFFNSIKVIKCIVFIVEPTIKNENILKMMDIQF